MRFLMLPEDERVFVGELVNDEWSLNLLLSDELDEGGRPQIVSNPVESLPRELPPPVRPLSVAGVPRRLTFWRPEWGVNTGEADTTAKGRVASLLTAEVAEAAGVDPTSLLDQARTPVVSFRRTHWVNVDSADVDVTLSAGAVGGMALPTTRWPQDLRRLVRKIERSLVKQGTRLLRDQFTSDRYQPKTFALPHAMEWVESGGRVYPWDA